MFSQHGWFKRLPEGLFCMKGCSIHMQFNSHIPSLFLAANNGVSFLYISLYSAKTFSVYKLATPETLSSSFFPTPHIGSQSVSVAQIVLTICQQLPYPVVPSARHSASESRPCCLHTLANASFTRKRASKQTPFHINHSWSSSLCSPGSQSNKKLYSWKEIIPFDFFIPSSNKELDSYRPLIRRIVNVRSLHNWVLCFPKVLYIIMNYFFG